MDMGGATLGHTDKIGIYKGVRHRSLRVKSVVYSNAPAPYNPRGSVVQKLLPIRRLSS